MLGHVLIIDDSKMDRFIAGKMVERSELAERIEDRELASHALDYINDCILRNDLPQVILLDINMPVMSGFDFLDVLSTIPEAQEKCNVVMLTSSLNEVDYVKAMSYPVVKKFFTKPLTLPKLQELDEFLSGKQQP